MLRILIVKTSSMGDVIHNLPVVTDIRERFPDAVIDWVVEEGFQDIPTLHPAVRSVIPVAIRRWRKNLFQRSTWHEIAAFKQRLAQHPYDIVLDTQGLLKSALLGLAAHGIRHGQDKASAREPIAARFYHRSHDIPKGQHAVIRNRALAAAALDYALPQTPPDYGIAQAVKARPYDAPSALPYMMGLHATSRDSKLWPTEHWIALGRWLANEGKALVLPWGNIKEKERADAIAQSVPQTVVLEKLRLSQLAPIMAHADAAIGVDTGLAHLAVALELPSIAIYTDTDPAFTGLHPGRNTPAANLGGIRSIPTPEEVRQAVRHIMPT